MRRAALLFLFALPLCAEPARYYVKPVYTSLRFSIVKWGVLKEEGIFRDFNGTLVYDPAHPEASRIDVVAKTASLDTKNDARSDGDRRGFSRRRALSDAGVSQHGRRSQFRHWQSDDPRHDPARPISRHVPRHARGPEHRPDGRIRNDLHDQSSRLRSARFAVGCGAGCAQRRGGTTHHDRRDHSTVGWRRRESGVGAETTAPTPDQRLPRESQPRFLIEIQQLARPAGKRRVGV